MKTALLFDLDGTLLDSDAEHLTAFSASSRRTGSIALHMRRTSWVPRTR
jgi:beta-phosphoglucomutase-like phosphatase (HAD superfamily)